MSGTGSALGAWNEQKNHKTKTVTFSISLPVTMRSPHNAASDVMNELGMNELVHETVTDDPLTPGRWLITFESVPGSLIYSRLHIEVMEGNPHAFACILERENVGYSAMNRIMDRLMRRLERAPRALQPSGQSPPGGEPRAPSPARDRRDPPEDDRPRNERDHMRT
jgi:hypothetical protein